MPKLSDRVNTFTDSVIRRMTRISDEYGAINLSQGFPDFDPPKEMMDALAKAAYEGPHQYSITFGAENFREALARKQGKAIGREINPDTEIVVTCGGTEAMMCAMMTICNPGDKVMVFSPFYENYGADAILSGAEPIYIPLVPPTYTFDIDLVEKGFQAGAKAIIVCNPSNPCGKVFTREELETIAALANKYDVYVISDEIWSDLILNGHKHIPSQSVSEDARQRTAAFYAPSKTFNLAGLVGSYHIVYNSWWRDRILKESSLSHYNMMNVLSMHALIGAYEAEGYTWVNELCQVLSENVEYAVNHIRDYYRGINVSKPQGTYMLFLDCEDWCTENYKSLDELLKAGWDVGVAWQDGRPFHQEYGIRMNLALPLSRVKEAFERLDDYVFHV